MDNTLLCSCLILYCAREQCQVKVGFFMIRLEVKDLKTYSYLLWTILVSGDILHWWWAPFVKVNVYYGLSFTLATSKTLFTTNLIIKLIRYN